MYHYLIYQISNKNVDITRLCITRCCLCVPAKWSADNINQAEQIAKYCHGDFVQGSIHTLIL